MSARPDAIDLRGLDPPEPMLRILEAIDAPGDGPYRFLLPHEPRPLYTMLRAQGWSHDVRHLERGVELTVFRPASDPLKPRQHPLP